MCFEDGFYSYEAKYLSKTTQYQIPPMISSAAVEAVETLAHEAYRALDCRGVARVDVMSSAKEQSEQEMWVDSRAVHLFDPDSGASLLQARD